MAGPTRTTDLPPDFFVSYSPADERWAVWIAATLEDAGYRTMIQAWDFVAGTNFIDFMDRGVSRSAAVIAVLSRNYLQSRYGRMEWQAALRAAPDRPESRLMTVRVEDHPLDGLLANLTYVDLVGVTDPETARELLLARVRETLAGRAKPTERPAYPNGQPSTTRPVPRTGAEPAPAPTRRARPRVFAPAYPAAGTTSPAQDALCVLHIAGPCFGRGLTDTGGPLDANGLQARIFGDVTQLVYDGAAQPDLVVVSGDLTASGNRAEFDAALTFLTGLRMRLKLAPDRLIVVPGNLDVNLHACQAYFNDCAADDLPPVRPYWPKWRHYVRLFQQLYQGFEDILFDRGQPYTLFPIEELRVVVAGLNSSMAVSHREEDQHGQLDADQAAWFAEQLRPYEEAGWLRLGVLRHPPGPVSRLDTLRDTPLFVRRVAPHLNLLFHGPSQVPADPGDTGLVCVSVPEPGRAELVTLTADQLTRWPDQASEPAEPVPVRWAAAGATFAPVGGVAQLPSEHDVPGQEVRDLTDPATELLNRIEEVCRARHGQVRVRHIRAELPYLVVTASEDDVVHETYLGGHLGQPTPADITMFRRQVQAADPQVSCELIYQGEPPAREVVEDARRAGVRVRSFLEFQGLLDLRGYVAGQTARLSASNQYPPHLYVPQRYRDLAHPGQPVRDGLVEELLRQVGGDDGRFILLLGDFGRGKTFALREVAQRIPMELPHLVPIFIELRALDKSHSIDGLVAAHLADHEERSIDLRGFRYMLREGRVVLLFDGFDELVTRTTYERATEHLEKLVQAATGRAKIVLTSRTQHFRSDRQVLTALGERVGLLSGRMVLSIEEFTPAQIRSYLVNHYRGDEPAAERRLRLISGVQNLLDLSHNPRMLSFVADLAEDRLRAVARVGQALSAAALYREILNAWLAVEERRTRGLPGAPAGLARADLWRAVTKLALRLWETNESVLRLSDLSEVADTLIGLSEGSLSVDQTTHALGTGSLLVRTDEGQFGFIHGSVVEWLVANEIAAQLGQGVAVLLAKRALTQLTVDFLCDLADVRVAEDWASAVLTDPAAEETARLNARRVVTRLRVPARADLRGAQLQGEDLSYRDLSEVDLTGADLTDARLVEANLTGARLHRARLVRARLDGAVLTGADLTGADLSQARLARTELTGVRVAGSRWRRTAVIASPGAGALAGAPELRGAGIAPGLPVRVQLSPAAVGVPYGFDIQIGRLPQPLAYSRDGGTLLIGCDSGVVLICDAGNGLPLRTLAGHRGRVYAVAAGPGTAVYSAASDGTLRRWDAITGAQRWSATGAQRWIWPLAVSADGAWVATADGTGTVSLRDARDGREVHRLTGLAAPVWGLVFRPGDAELAGTGSQATALVWEVATGRVRHELAGHTGSIYRVCYDPTGGLLATGDEDGVVRVFDADRAVRRAELTGHTRAVYALDFHPHGNLLATGDKSGAIRLHTVPDGQLVGELRQHTSAVYQVLFSPDGALLASADSGGAVQLWTAGERSDVLPHPHAELVGHRAAVWPGVFRPDGEQFATTSNDASVRLWDVRGGLVRHVLRGHGRRVSSVSFDRTGAMLASCGNDGAARLWDPVTGVRLRTLTGTGDQLVSVLFNPAGRTVAAASNDGGIHMFAAATGVAERELAVEAANVWSEAFSPDGTVLATANDDDTVRLWFHHTGAQGHNLADHRGRVRSIAFSADGTLVATGCDDRLVRLWDVESGQCQDTLIGHTDRVYAVAFRPGAHQLASAGWDGTVRIWDLDSAVELRALAGHTDRVWAAAFHPGGGMLASAGDDAVIRIWHPETGQRLATLEGHTGRVYALAFSPDGTLLASGGDDGTVRLWRVVDGGTPVAYLILIGHGDAWAAVAPDGRYKVDGELTGDFWYAVGACRFEPGELDGYLDEVRRLGLAEPFG